MSPLGMPVPAADRMSPGGMLVPGREVMSPVGMPTPGLALVIPPPGIWAAAPWACDGLLCVDCMSPSLRRQ
jgi:hypothetical protein